MIMMVMVWTSQTSIALEKFLFLANFQMGSYSAN